MKKGFTLIELLVLIAIISILTSIVLSTIVKIKETHSQSNQKDSKITETLK